MRFTQDTSSQTNVIRAYSPGELRINDDTYRETVMVSGSTIVIVPDVRVVDDLPRFDVSQLLALEPELVLLGTGPAQVFPAAAFRAKSLPHIQRTGGRAAPGSGVAHGAKISGVKWQGAYGIHDQYGIEIYCSSS